MASSSFNSSFSLQNGSAKQFEEAFEELYMQSPLPRLVQPLFATKEKQMAPPAARVQNKAKIKAIFDTMKERNSSMCSELSSSICTSNASFCDADVETLPAKQGQRPKEKENHSPTPKNNQEEVDHLSESNGSPRNGQRPPVPQSPAMRAALNFARCAAQLEGSSARELLSNTNASNADREIHETRLEPAVAVIDKAQGCEKCPQGERPCSGRTLDLTAPAASRHFVKTGHMTDSGDTEADCQKDAENETEEICMPISQSPSEGTAVQSVQSTDNSLAVLTATVAMKSASVSPSNKASEESHADQETLQLVSKLVQHLQSSAEKRSGSDDEDHQDLVSLPVLSQSQEKSATKDTGTSQTDQHFKRSQKPRHGKVGTGTFSKTVDESVKNSSDNYSRKTAVGTKTAGNEESENKGRRLCKGQPKEMARTQTLRTRKRGQTVMETSNMNDKIENMKTRGKSAIKPQRKPPNKRTDGDKVEVDVIGRRMVKPDGGAKDPFSLDDSSSDGDLQVEEDAVAYATKKSDKSKPVKAEEEGVVSRTRSGRQRCRKEQEAGETVKTGNRGKGKILKLSSWSLQPVARLKSVRIEGKLPNTEYFWLSSVIVERVSSRVLKTTNGSLYQLVGNMASLHTRAAGFSAEVAQLFKSGFPAEWKELLESSVAAAELNASALQTSTLPVSSKDNRKPSNTAQHEKMASPKRNLRKRANPSSFRTPQRAKKDTEEKSSIWTPRGVMSRMVGAKEVRCTQSGRCVIPPLARWAGQYLERDGDGNVTIGFRTTAAEKHFAAIAEHEMHVPTRLRNSPMTTRIRGIRLANASKKGSPAQQNKTAQCVASNKGKKSAVANKSFRKRGKIGRVLENIPHSDVSLDSEKAEVLTLEEDVMSLVQKSKAKRMQKMGIKRVTCYSNAADDCHQNTDKTAPFDSAGNNKDFITQKNPANLVTKSVSISLKKLTRDFTKNFSEKTQSSEKSNGKLTRLQSHTKPSVNTVQHKKPTKNAGKVRNQPQLSDSADSEENSEKRANTRSRACRGRAADRQNRKKKQLESFTATDTSDSEDDFKVGHNNSADLTDSDSSASSTALSTDVSMEITSSKRGASLTNATGNKDSVVSNTISKSRTTGPSLRTRKRVQNKKSDQKSSSSLDMELSMDSSDTEEDEEEKVRQDKRKTRQRPTGQCRQTRGVQGQKKNPQSKTRKAGFSHKENLYSEDLDGARPWSKEETENLHRGIESINSDHPEFWEAVSRYVGSRSSKECAAFCLKDSTDKGPNNKLKKQKMKQNAKPPVLSGRSGTLKRRQELRAILEHDNNNQSPDDLFHATPFRTKKRAKVAAIDFSKTDEEVFGSNPDFFTPRNDRDLQVGHAFSHTPASSRRTPSISLSHSPWQNKDSAQKRDVDQYIHRLKKNKRQLTKSFGKKRSRQCEEKDDGADCATSVRLFNQSPVPDGLFHITEESSCGEEEDEDYYYSEEEN